jgi:hypothetical protein
VDHLIIEQPFDERVVVLAKLCLGALGECHGTQGPDSIR